MKVVAIIPAAGLGTRMAAVGGGRNAKSIPAKQFAELGGTAILIHTLRRFVAAPLVAEVHLALRLKGADSFREALAREDFKKPIHIVEGGEHRQESVAHALSAVDALSDDIVLVHDAVRPFVSQEIISSVIQAAEKHGAAIAGVPAVDTIKLVDRSAENALITSTVPRERAVLAQTPQGFRVGILRQAMEAALADGFTGTDEASLVERLGNKVVVVMGSPRNLKITTPADLELAEFYFGKGI